MNKDVSSILDLIGQLSESAVTPVDVKHGLNAQQRSVPQLPADARARKTSVLAAKKDPKHPFAGYMVGSNESVKPDPTLDEADFNPGRRGFLKKAGAAATAAAMPKGLAGAAVKAVSPSVAKASVALTDKELHDLVAKIWDQDAEEFAQEILSGGGESLSPAQAAYLKQQAKAYKLDLRDPDSAESFVSAMTEQLPDEYVDRIGGDSGDRQGGFGGDYHDMEADYFDEKGNWAGNSEWEAETEGGIDRDDEDDYDEDDYEPFEDHEVIERLQKDFGLTPGEAKRTFEYGLRIFQPSRGVWSSYLYDLEDVLGWTEKYGYGNRPNDSDIPGGPDKPTSAVGKAAGRIGNAVGQAAKQYVDKNVKDVKSHVKDFYNKPAELPAPTDPDFEIPTDIKQKERVPTTDKDLKEADFNPGRRGFLKKAGAAAATAAMPKGIAGAAMKAAAPAASTLSAPLAGLSAIDLDDIINLLMTSNQDDDVHGPYDLDTIKKIAEDAARNSWGNGWFVNGNAAQALLDTIALGKKKHSDDEDIIQDIFIVAKKQYMQELKQLSPEEVAKVKSQSLSPANKSEPESSPTTGISSLARAASTQIGSTMKNVGRSTADTILNQPARDMGRIEPTAEPAALPAPSVSPGMQIPKQKTKVTSPFSDDHSELDQFVKEEFNREIDEEVTERQISVRRLADVIINEILRNKDVLHTYGQDKILRAASSVASEWVDRKFSKEHLPVMVKSAMDKISSNQLDEFDASGFSERYTMYCDNDVFGRYEDVDDAVADAQQMMNDDYRMKGCFWVLKDISGETVWSQEPGDIIDAARQQNKIRFIDPGKDLEEDRDQPVNQGWNDFTVDGYRYEPWEEEEFDRDNKKIHHSVRTPAGEVVSVDWDPYEYMEPGDLKSWIDLGMPTRQHAGTIGPLRADHLDQLAAQKKTVDETSFADAGEVVGGIVGGPAAFALARGRGGKKTYAAGSVAGSAIGNAAGRWIDNKIAPAAGVDQHGPGPMSKRYTKPIDESPETLYFFDVANTTGSYTDQQLRSLGLRQTQSGKWYYKPIGNNTQAVDAIAQRLNVQPKPWTPVREGNPAADWPIFGESQDNTVASHTFADTGSAFRNGQEDAMNFRPKNDAKYIRGHKYRSNYSDGYKYGLTQQDRSINPKTGQPYVLFGPNGPTTDSDPERSMHGDGPHVWVCSSYRQAKKQADKWGQKVARAGVSKWKVVPKDDPAPEIFSESDLNEVTGDKSFDSMMGNIVKGARYKGAKADQQADTAYGNMIQGITKNTNAVRQPSSNSKFEQIYNQVERILLSSHIHSEIDYDIMDALKKLKIKATDKLIQKLENTLVSRVSDVLKFYDESDLNEVTGDLPFDTMLSKIVAGGNLQTLAAKIVAKIKKFPQYRMPGEDRDEKWANGYPDGHFFGDDIWIDDSFDSIMGRWKKMGPDKFADQDTDLSLLDVLQGSNDYTNYWNGVLEVFRRLESIPGATEQLAKMVWHGLFSGNVEQGITDIGKPGVSEGIGDEDGENKDYALALAQYGMKVLQGMEKICQQIDALPEPKKSKYLNTLTDVEFAQSGDLVQYVIDTLGLKIDDFMEFQDAWEEEGGEPFYIWIHEWLEGHWDEFVAPWKKFTMKVLQGRGLGPTLHEAEGAETKIRAKNRAVVKKLQNTEVKEDITQEDIITKLKAKLGDYLSDLGQQIKKDPALKDKLADKPRDTIGPAVKTVTTDDGQTISIHGNEDDGFRISIKNKPATAKFKTVDEAALACTMFNARRKNPRINTDYVDKA